jgi:hypothetical protein
MLASNIKIDDAIITEASIEEGWNEEGTDIIVKVTGSLQLNIVNVGLAPAYITSMKIESIRVKSESGNENTQIVGNEMVDSANGNFLPPFATLTEDVRFYAKRPSNDYGAYTLLLSLREFFCENKGFETYMDYSVNTLLSSSNNNKELTDVVEILETTGDTCEEFEDS